MEMSHLLTRCLDKRLRLPCLLLVHEEIGQLQRMAQQLAEDLAQAPLDIGLLLSEALLPVPDQQRAGRVQPALMALLSTRQPGPILCTGIDLLFEPKLAQDPLSLLLSCSRHIPLIVMWPGSFRNRVLTYGTQAYSYHRTWNRPEVQAGCIQVIS